MEWEYQTLIIDPIERGIKKPLKDLKYVKDLKRVWKLIKPDCIISHTTKANIYTQLSKSYHSSSILVVNGLGDGFSRKGLLSNFLRTLYRVSFRKAQRVVFQNRADQNRFLSDRIVSESQVRLIEGSGIDTKLYRPKDRKSEEVIKFIYVGRLLTSKGVMMLQEAFSALSELPISLSVVGGLDLGNATSLTTDELELLASTDNIDVLGHRSDILELLVDHDVFIFPTYYNEGLPRAILEALASGLPVITTTVAGCRDVIDPGVDGFLVEPRSQEELLLAIERFTALSTSERRTMRQAARAKAVEKYDIRIVDAAYATMVNEIIE